MKKLIILGLAALQVSAFTASAEAAGAKLISAWCESVPNEEKVVLWLVTDKGNFRGSPSFGNSGQERMFNCNNDANGLNKALTDYRLAGGLSTSSPVRALAAWCESVPSEEKVVMWLVTDRGSFRGSPSFGADGQERMFNCNNEVNGVNNAIAMYQRH